MQRDNDLIYNDDVLLFQTNIRPGIRIDLTGSLDASIALWRTNGRVLDTELRGVSYGIMEAKNRTTQVSAYEWAASYMEEQGFTQEGKWWIYPRN